MENTGSHGLKTSTGPGLLSDISKNEWEVLVQKRIFFGHQSTGQNIVEGILDLFSENDSVKLNIVEKEAIDNLSGGFLSHTRLGKNREPFSKIDAFVKFVDQKKRYHLDTVFFKFCYVDVNSKTDIKAIFDRYKKEMGDLQTRHPELTVAHFTVPLTLTKTTIKTRLKKIIGANSIWEYADNIKRNELNTLIISEYKDHQPVFDIADIEASRSDGLKETFTFKDQTYLSLAAEHTDDGAHLNKKGRQKVAEELVRFLIHAG